MKHILNSLDKRMNMRDFIKFIKRTAYYTNIELFNSFPGSKVYWDQRYSLGGTSGVGSYGEFAEFKAIIINRFIKEENITSVIEYGCGDGNQLTLFNCPTYIGFDVSEKAIAHCNQLFSDDETKTFKLVKNYDGESAELTLSLDVIYHIIEDDLFHDYMTRLFESASRYVIIYSSNTDKQKSFQMTHVKHRRFTDWVKKHQPEWSKKSHIPTKNKTFADFYVFQKQG